MVAVPRLVGKTCDVVLPKQPPRICKAMFPMQPRGLLVRGVIRSVHHHDALHGADSQGVVRGNLAHKEIVEASAPDPEGERGQAQYQ